MRRRHQGGEQEQKQAGLFDRVSGQPVWPDLPIDVRRTATELLARMVRQVRCRRASCRAQEVGHE
jgi:hypothetical protein